MKPRQNETEYQEIKKILTASKVTSPTQIQEKIDGMIKAAKMYSIGGTGIVIALLIALPKYAIFTVLLFCLYMAWLWSSTLSGKHYFTRYLSETSELKSNKDNLNLSNNVTNENQSSQQK